MASKLCDSCKSATAVLFCRPDSAFLCQPCDSRIHAANKLASRHPRLPLCEVCEQAPAHVTCKADAAALCLTCDHDIHSANPLARRHDRIPIAPFYDAAAVAKPPSAAAAINFLDDHSCFNDADADADDVSREEAEAASWLLPTPSNPKAPDLNSGQFLHPEIDPVPYVDLEFGSSNPKMETQEQNHSSGTTDGVVPFVYGYKYNTQSHCVSLSHSVSSSSMEVGVVPDGNTMSEISNCCTAVPLSGENETVAVAVAGADREARVMRYREKRKNRRFEKTIRYASRKAYAETRPRIKGRFAKRTDVDVLVEEDPFAGYGVVPTC